MSYPVAPVGHPDDTVRRIATVVNTTLLGRINSTGTFTLTASTTTTAVTDPNATASSVILWMPTTANAAAEIGSGGMYVSAQANESFTVTHANNAQTDRDFSYVILG